MTSYEQLLEILHYGNEALAVEVFHILTNNRYKANLELLVPFKEYNSSGEFTDYSGNGHDGVPKSGASLTGIGNARAVFTNGVVGVDTQYISFSNMDFGTNDFSFAFNFNFHGAEFASSNADVISLHVAAPTQQIRLVVRSSTNVARFTVNGGALNDSTESLDKKPRFITANADRDGFSRLYFDEVLQTSSDISASSATDMNMGGMSVMRRDVASFNYVSGNINWLFCWNGRLLTQNEMRELKELLTPRSFGI